MDKPGATGSGAQEEMALGERRNPPDTSLTATLAEHSQKFNDILNAVLNIKNTLETKIDALWIDMGHLREDHKKLKERVEATKSTVSDVRPLVVDAASHISAFQKERTFSEHNIKYVLQFPATVRATMDNITTFCTTPDIAWAWLECRGITHTILKPPSQSMNPRRWGNRVASRQRPRAGPLREQAAKERAQIVTEVELQTESPPSPVLSGEQLDVAITELDDD
ncbi:hypothetical protein NDU88_006234 [Pleurodeles waltl]|uniref:Uncharacterized protein n=1 Tax=Pleurodeles waltl TaxID=8319 RepID=A0AAV7PKH3_PLEWA|nr:hypothetical protein NDU88_006234 [Pleurodeles waltl]